MDIDPLGRCGLQMNRIFKRLLSLKFRTGRRYKVKPGVYVVYNHGLNKNQVNDVSMGGISFYYVDHGYSIDRGADQLKLVSDGHTLLGKIPFKRVADEETGQLLLEKKGVRCQRVKFTRLTHLQRKQLRAFIGTHTEI